MLLPLLLIGCIHRGPGADGPAEEVAQADACAHRVAQLEAAGQSREAWETAAACPSPDPTLQAVLLAEAHPEIVATSERVGSWQRLCGLGFLPGCEVGARTLAVVDPEAAAVLATSACASGWEPACGPLDPASVELPEPFAAALTPAGAVFRMPSGFHPVEVGSQALWAIASDDGRMRVDFVVLDDSAMAADGRTELFANMAATIGMQTTGRLPASEVRQASFPPLFVGVEYNAHRGGSAVYLSGATQVLTLWVHRDPSHWLGMVCTFDDPAAVQELLPRVGHALGFTAPVGLPRPEAP